MESSLMYLKMITMFVFQIEAVGTVDEIFSNVEKAFDAEFKPSK